MKRVYGWRFWVLMAMFPLGVALLILGWALDFTWVIERGFTIVGWFLTITGGAKVYHWLKTVDQGYPGEREIEAFLLDNYVKAAIVAAYQVSESFVDDNLARLRGADKRKIAVWLYSKIPEVINIGGFLVPVGLIRRLVSEERFATLVQNAFDDLTDAFGEVWLDYTNEIDDLLLLDT